MIKANVYVTLKPSVLDAQGAVVQRALATLGFADVAGVRVGKCIEITLQTDDRARARAQLQQMGERLLSNPVIENFRFDVEPATARRRVAHLPAPRTRQAGR